VISLDTFGRQDFINIANGWCVKAIAAVLPASALPKGKLEYVLNFLAALEQTGDTG